MTRWLILFGLIAMAGCQAAEKATTSTKEGKAKKKVEVDPLRGYVEEEFRATSRAGRYEGWLVGTSDRYAAALDLFEVTTGNYEGILSIHWGDNGSRGFVIDDITMRGGKMVITHPFLMKMELQFADDLLQGEMGTRGDQNRGRLVLARRGHQPLDASSFPKDVTSKWLATPIAGEYKGMCDETEAAMQVEVFPFRDGEETEHWFSGVEVRGRVAKPDDLMCGAGSICVQRNFLQSDFRLIDGVVEFQGLKDRMTCQKVGPQLDCGACTFTRKEQNAKTAGKVIPKNKIILDREWKDFITPTAVGVSGEYFGYLHHERRDVYQLISLSSKAEMNEGKTTSDVVVTAYLGEGDTSEFSVFRFDGAEFPENNMLQLTGTPDPVIRIAHWNKGIIRGYWFSKTQGRIGEFQLVRDGVPELAQGLTQESSLSGAFQSSDWEFAILANGEIANDNDFRFPLRVFGNALEHREGARARQITKVRYNVYTGHIGFLLDDQRLVTGHRHDEGWDLVWPAGPRFGTKLSAWQPATFQRDENTRVRASRK